MSCGGLTIWHSHKHTRHIGLFASIDCDFSNKVLSPLNAFNLFTAILCYVWVSDKADHLFHGQATMGIGHSRDNICNSRVCFQSMKVAMLSLFVRMSSYILLKISRHSLETRLKDKAASNVLYSRKHSKTLNVSEMKIPIESGITFLQTFQGFKSRYRRFKSRCRWVTPHYC